MTANTMDASVTARGLAIAYLSHEIYFAFSA
jgi:hypothetical protein